MYKFKMFAKKWYNYTIIMFTIIILSFALIAPNNGALLRSEIFNFFGFSICASLGICVSNMIKNNVVLRQAVRFVLVYASYAVFFFAFGKGNNHLVNESANKVFTVIVLTLVYVGIYVVVNAVLLGVVKIKKLIENRNSVYTKQFDGVNKELKK